MFDNFNVNLRKNEGISNLYSVYSYSGIRSIERILRLKFILSIIAVGYSTQNSGKLETLVGTNLAWFWDGPGRSCQALSLILWEREKALKIRLELARIDLKLTVSGKDFRKVVGQTLRDISLMIFLCLMKRFSLIVHTYGIQGIGGTLVKSIQGDYFNVMGFPLYHFCLQIRKLFESKTSLYKWLYCSHLFYSGDKLYQNTLFVELSFCKRPELSPLGTFATGTEVMFQLWSLQPISRNTDDNAAMFNCWGTNKTNMAAMTSRENHQSVLVESENTIILFDCPRI